MMDLSQDPPLDLSEASAVKALAALAQSSRLRVFRAIVGAGPEGMQPGQISQALGVPANTLSFHLKELHQVELISVEREGRFLRYRANMQAMQSLVGFLTDHCCQGQPCEGMPMTRQASPLPHTFSTSGATIMTQRHVLFLCTGNSSRSIMAEAILNHLAPNRFVAFSAGSHAAGQVKPQALQCLERNHMSTAGLRSKSWNEFSGPDAPGMDFVITVCDQAAAEICPVWPGQPLTAHWGVQEPAQEGQSAEQSVKAYWNAFMTLHRRIAILLSLPLEKLDRLALQSELQRIGQS